MSTYYDFDVSIINIADDFFDAYKRCIEGKNERIDEYGRKVYSTANIPAIVNAAFACELYFKSMLPENVTGHNLKELFSKLSTSIQMKFKNSIKPQLTTLNWNKDFDGYLEDIADVFQFWRYIHEKKKPEGFLGNRINECLSIFAIILPKLQDIATQYNKKT